MLLPIAAVTQATKNTVAQLLSAHVNTRGQCDFFCTGGPYVVRVCLNHLCFLLLLPPVIFVLLLFIFTITMQRLKVYFMLCSPTGDISHEVLFQLL